MSKQPVVVLIDDEKVDLTVLSRIIRTSFPQVKAPVLFSEPAKGLEFITGNDVDVVITDVSMGDISGHDILYSCRDAAKGIKVVITTSDQTFSLAHSFFLEGADAYLTKPFKNEEVAVILGGVFDNLNRWEMLFQKKLAGAK